MGGDFFRWIAKSGAGIVAVAAVGLAVWEGFENRRHNRLSVVPNIDAVRDFDMLAQTFALGLVSSGLGPAVVQDVRLYLDGELKFDRNSTGEYPWSEFFVLFKGMKLELWDDYLEHGKYLIPGERYNLLWTEGSEDAVRVDDFRDRVNRISISICYCSVYGDQCATEVLGIVDVDPGQCPQ